jgi:hypothetical protein
MAYPWMLPSMEKLLTGGGGISTGLPPHQAGESNKHESEHDEILEEHHERGNWLKYAPHGTHQPTGCHNDEVTNPLGDQPSKLNKHTPVEKQLGLITSLVRQSSIVKATVKISLPSL